jgi:ABC-type Fe3+/spermidine/putrescine transport system ATPase subunit
MDGKISEVREQGMTVTVIGGPVLSVPKQDLYNQGDDVTVFVRYERLEVLPAQSAEGSNVITGVIDHSMFLGTNYLYRISVGPSLMLVTTEANTRRKVPFEKGTKVCVKVEPENVGLIRKDRTV